MAKSSCDEQRVFARLAIFRGGWTLDAAEGIANGDLDVLTSLEGLVDKSLVVARDGRFSMLETVREFASERLAAAGERSALETRHAAWFVALAEDAEPHLRQDSLEWLERLECEHDNLRATFDRLAQRQDTQRLLRLAGSIYRFWYLRGHLAEGTQRAEAALAADETPTPARAAALDAAAVMAVNTNRPQAALRYAQAALALHREFGEPWHVAYATMMVANALAEGDAFAAARPIHLEAVKRFRDLGDTRYELTARLNLAWVTTELGDRATGRALHEENVRLAVESGNDRIESFELAQVAMVDFAEGHLDDARTRLARAVAVNHRRGDPLQLAFNVARIAEVFTATGRFAVAGRLAAASQRIFDILGQPPPRWTAERFERVAAMVAGGLGPEAAETATREGRALGPDEIVRLIAAQDRANGPAGGEGSSGAAGQPCEARE